MNRTNLIATVSLAIVVLTMVTSNQLSTYASQVTEDDGWTEGEDESNAEYDNDEEVEDSYDGSPREFEDGNDEEEDVDKLAKVDNDDSNSDTNDDLPLCRWGVKEDCQVKNGMTCLVENRDDPCMDIWGGFTGETQAEFEKRVGKIVESSTYPWNDDPR